VPTYSGKYKVKNRSKYRGNPDNVIYRSLWERHCFVWLDNNPSVTSWSSEETIVPYLYEVDKKYHRYFVDLVFTDRSGKTYMIEVKPEKETIPPTNPNKSKRYIAESLTYIKNQNKWKAADKYAKKKGWIFQIWTEKHLQQLGILPKTAKALPKLKPLKARPKQ